MRLQVKMTVVMLSGTRNPQKHGHITSIRAARKSKVVSLITEQYNRSRMGEQTNLFSE